MNPDKKNNGEQPQNGDSSAELRENEEIALVLRRDILGVDDEKAKMPEILRSKPLTAIKRSAELRMAALLAEPIETRRQAMHFLEDLLALIDGKTVTGSAKIRNSETHIDGTVVLIEDVDRLGRRVRETENMIRATLKTDDQGGAECSSANIDALQRVLQRSLEAFRRLEDGSKVQGKQEDLGDVSYMKPGQALTDIASQLRGVRNTADARLTVEAFSMTEGHLRSLVQKTDVGVRMDGFYSGEQFGDTLRDLTEIRERVAAAEMFETPPTEKDRENWQAALTDGIFILAQVIGRTEHLYRPNVNDFLGLVDQTALIQRVRHLKAGEAALEARIQTTRALQRSSLKRAGHALRTAFTGGEKLPQVPLSRLTEQQKKLRQKIMMLAEVIKRREAMDR